MAWDSCAHLGADTGRQHIGHAQVIQIDECVPPVVQHLVASVASRAELVTALTEVFRWAACCTNSLGHCLTQPCGLALAHPSSGRRICALAGQNLGLRRAC